MCLSLVCAVMGCCIATLGEPAHQVSHVCLCHFLHCLKHLVEQYKHSPYPTVCPPHKVYFNCSSPGSGQLGVQCAPSCLNLDSDECVSSFLPSSPHTLGTVPVNYSGSSLLFLGRTPMIVNRAVIVQMGFLTMAEVSV